MTSHSTTRGYTEEPRYVIYTEGRGQMKRPSMLLFLGFTQPFRQMLEKYFNPFMAAVVFSLNQLVCWVFVYYPYIYVGK